MKMENTIDNQMSKQEEVKERVKALLNQLEDGIKNLFESEKYKEYLNVMSRFHNYSCNNLMLIYMQYPQATNIAGYESWKRSFNRHVKKGEKAIKIIAPEFVKREVEVTKKDSQGNVIYDDNGEPVKDKKMQEYISYRITNVFDVSQTEGEDLPTLTHRLNSDIKDFDTLVKAIENVSPVPVHLKRYEGKSNGYYDLKKREIYIQQDMSETQIIKTMLHEVAHSILHDKETGKYSMADAQTKEVQAESVAYCVSNYLGIDSSSYSFGYIAGWSRNKELAELKNSLNIINKTASKLINELDYRLTGKQLYDVEKIKDAAYKKDNRQKRSMKH